MKLYTNDILYFEDDKSEEIFFIQKGCIKFYVNLNKGTENTKPRNVPIYKFVTGSYFGDSDVLINQGRTGRESSAKAENDCML